MIKSGIKKELMLFTRGFKLLGVIITILAISLLYPFTYKSMELMANQISDMGQQFGGETQGQVENSAASINNMLGSISEMYGGSMAAVGFKTGVSSLTSTGSLVIMLLLMSAAGGMITGGISNLIYNNELIISDIVFSSVCSAIYMFFITAVYFLTGLSTGRPGISVIIVYAGSTIVPLILQALNIDKYNPFTLQTLLMSSYSEADMNNFILSTVVSVVLSVISCLLTLMITTLRKIDNSVGEANL